MAEKSKQPFVEIGDVLADKYRVERELGAGGMGVVLEAVHLDLGELRAIKVLLPERSSSPEMEERFLREARAVARLRNAHVTQVHDVGRLPTGEPFIVMEHLLGQDLKDLLKARGCALGVQDAAGFIMQALEGIAEAHAVGIVHRDLKPANLFLTEDADGLPCIKVLDFGISKVTADLALGGEMTQTASMLGTPLYMAPEQMRSAKDVDRRSDIWSLGVILYKLLTGRTPFHGDSVTAVCLDVVEREPLLPSSFNLNIPTDFEAIVMRCLEKDREHRYQHALELATALAPHAGPQAQASLSRINRWHHAPPPAPTTNPSFPGLTEGSSAAGLRAAPPAVGSGSGRDRGALGEPTTAASWGRTGGASLAVRRPRPLWAIALVGAGVVAVVLVALFALGDSSSPTEEAGTESPAEPPEPPTAPAASPPEAPERSEGVDEFTTATESSAGQGGAQPVPEPAKPRPRPPKAKPLKPKPTPSKPASTGSDPFGQGRW